MFAIKKVRLVCPTYLIQDIQVVIENDTRRFCYSLLLLQNIPWDLNIRTLRDLFFSMMTFILPLTCVIQDVVSQVFQTSSLDSLFLFSFFMH